MKKTILLLPLIYSSLVLGQVSSNYKDKARFGIRAGVNYVNYTETENEKFEPKTGFDIGVFYNTHFFKNKKFFMPFELVYSNINFESQLRTYNFSKIGLNMMFSYYITDNFYVELGPSIGYYIAGKATKKENVNLDDYIVDLTVEEATNVSPTLDVPIMGGIGYEFNNRLFINLRYGFDVANVWSPLSKTDEELKSYSRHPSFSIGYSF